MGSLAAMIALKEMIAADGQPVPGAPLGALLSAHAAATPHAPAFTLEDRTWNFLELDEAANRRARILSDRFSVVHGDRVAITMRNCVEFVEATFAIWKLGAVPCPVSWRLTEREWGALATLLGARCVISDGSVPSIDGVPIYDIRTPLPRQVRSDPLAPVATVPGKIMTSGGSTGMPKLVVDPEPSAWGSDKEGRRRPPRLTLINPGPLYHSAPFSYVMMSIAQGSHAVCFAKFDPLSWIEAVERHRPTFAYLVPTMMGRIAKFVAHGGTGADLSSLETMIHMAAPCPPSVKRWWIDKLGPEVVLEVYGGTERIGATLITGQEWLEHPGSVGRAPAGTEIVILGPDGRELEKGQIGEIFFRQAKGAGEGYSYVGSETRIQGDIDSFGDLGWLDDEGWLFIADRRTDMVVVGGMNIYPAEIESAIETIPGVLCAAVIGLPDDDMGNRLHAVVELEVNTQPPNDGLAFLDAAVSLLSPYKRPRSVEFTHERIRDDAGKMRRSRLREERLNSPKSV